ncbi:hypothetical protein BZG36_05535, partial [Bifiguratus adelaidae]
MEGACDEDGLDRINADFAAMKSHFGATMVRVYLPQCYTTTIWEHLLQAGVANNMAVILQVAWPLNGDALDNWKLTQASILEVLANSTYASIAPYVFHSAEFGTEPIGDSDDGTFNGDYAPFIDDLVAFRAKMKPYGIPVGISEDWDRPGIMSSTDGVGLGPTGEKILAQSDFIHAHIMPYYHNNLTEAESWAYIRSQVAWYKKNIDLPTLISETQWAWDFNILHQGGANLGFAKCDCGVAQYTKYWKTYDANCPFFKKNNVGWFLHAWLQEGTFNMVMPNGSYVIPNWKPQTSSVLVVAGLGAVLFAWRSSANNAKLLPKPPSIPFLGNMHLLLGGNPMSCFQKWGKKLGPIFRFQMGSQDWIIINDASIAHELCSGRGTIYNSRPLDNKFARILSHDFKNLGGSKYGDDWRKRRRIFVDALGSRRFPIYLEQIDVEALLLIKNLAKTKSTPIDPTSYMKLLTFNIIMKILADYRLEDPNDPELLEELELEVRLFKAFNPAGNLVAFLPFLKIFPQSWVGPKIEDVWDLRHAVEAKLQRYLDMVSARIANGEDIACFCRDLLEKQQEGQLDRDELIELMSDTMFAGLETSTSTLIWLTAELANQPELQVTLQQEMRDVLGPDVCPKHDDTPKLPLLQSCVREALRLHPAGPIGLPHATSEDDVYNGYFIPKDTTILTNIYTMNRDPVKYPDPATFNPYRYIDERQSSVALTKGKVESRDHFAFGFGRRICAGMHIAEAEVLAAAGAVIWAFDIERPSEALIDTEGFDLGLTLSALPFKVKFVPRQNLDNLPLEDLMLSVDPRKIVDIPEKIVDRMGYNCLSFPWV